MTLGFAKGYDTGYLTKSVAGGREGYYSHAVAAGEPAGVWYGAGAELLGLRGEVDSQLLEAVYKHLADPRDANAHVRESVRDAATLGSPHRKYRSAEEAYQDLLADEPNAGPEQRKELRKEAARAARQPVAFIDMTFSAPKSVSVLGCAFERAANDARKAGDLKAAEAWDAHRKAVEDAVMAGARTTMDLLQDDAGYARVGRHGGGAGRWMDSEGFVVAQFLQHDSRDRDPQLHVHQAILNRIQREDGSWGTLDSRALNIYKRAASVAGERVMEAELARTLGLRFETRKDGTGREIVGVDEDVRELFSSRTRKLTPKAAELVKEFTEKFGREPTPVERKHIRQEATLATRRAKSHTAEDVDVRLDRWERQVRQKVGMSLAQVARNALEQGAQGTPEPAEWSEEVVIELAIEQVGRHQQTWTRSDVTWAISNALPANLGIPAEQIRPVLEMLTDKALDQMISIAPESSDENLPQEFRLKNGRSAFEAPGRATYTAQQQVVAERILQEAAVLTGATALTKEQADAVIARYAENGRELGADQAAAVRGVLTSGAYVEVITAAAGAGKSFTVGGIAEVWAEHGHKTIGLTTAQRAANVLTKEGVNAFNLAAWRGAQERLDAGRGSEADQALVLSEGDLVVVDEAGMAETADLAYVAERCEAAKAKLLLVGDDRQLAAVGPGGALSDLGAKAKPYELTEVRRFKSSWEAEASLRLRNGDDVAVEQYDKHGRIHAQGTPEDAQQAAERAWLGDTLDGKNSMLLVSSNEAANEMSGRLREQLVRLGKVAETGVQLGWDSNIAGVGDLVRARKNAWNLKGYEGNDRAPVNQDTYRVVEAREDGSMRVEPVLEWTEDGAQYGTPLTLPADYVSQHLSLAYASTLYSAQGCTVDTAHTVVSQSSAASDVYVGLTRGRFANHAWISTQAPASDAPVGEAQVVEPREATAIFTEVLERAEEQRGALAEQAQAAEDAASTFRNVDQLITGIEVLTGGTVSTELDLLASEGVITPQQRQELAADTAMGSVGRLLRHAEVAGHSIRNTLREALTGSLAGADHPARVLHARLRDRLGNLTPKITSFRDLIPGSVSARHRPWLEELADASDDRRRELGARLAEDAPQWAIEALGPVPTDAVGRADWEHRAGWAGAHRENMQIEDATTPLGSAPPAGLPEKHAVWWTAHDELRLPDIGPAEESCTDGQLRARWIAWQREQAWAPKYVADELAATNERVAARRTDAQVWAARAETLDDPEEAQALRDEAAKARLEVEDLEHRAAVLEEADKVRARYYAHTAVLREHAVRAKATLEARGKDVDSPSDLATTADWLAAQRAEQAVEEQHLPIREDDIAEDVLVDDAPAVMEVELETAVPDIRETAVAHPTEAVDDDPHRHVPTDDELAEEITRYRDALLELDSRHEYDATREGEDAEEQVIWWAADRPADTYTDEHTAGA